MTFNKNNVIIKKTDINGVHHRGCNSFVSVFIVKGGVKMKINGENFSQSKPVLLRDLIKNLGYSTDKIAVELNGDIVPKSSYSEITARSGDIIEIVSFVGGG